MKLLVNLSQFTGALGYQLFQLLFPLILDQRHLDGGIEFLLTKGFEQVTKKMGLLDPLEGDIIRIGGQINHRQIKVLPEMQGCFDAIHAPRQTNVHQNQMRRDFRRQVDSFLPRSRNSRRLVPQLFQTYL
ncbi:MAG: hypothetical protein HC875_11385 [Anaerolineales bacterium]|nr:hypothetical protein [Anaerolineales bacterium]